MCVQIESYPEIAPGEASLHSATVLRLLTSSSHVKCRSISEIIAAATNPRVVPTTSSVPGALPPEAIQPTLNSQRLCDTCSVGINSAHTLGHVSMLLVPRVYLQAETLGGVVMSGRPCTPFKIAGTIHQHRLLFVYIDFSMRLFLIENCIARRFLRMICLDLIGSHPPLLCLERGVWPLVKRLRHALHEYSPPTLLSRKQKLKCGVAI